MGRAKSLTVLQCRSLMPKPDGSPNRLAHGGGENLWLEARALGNGKVGRYWGCAATVDGKRLTTRLGKFDEKFGPKEAREAERKWRESVMGGQKYVSSMTFQAFALEHLDRESTRIDPRTDRRNRQMLADHVFPILGGLDISAIDMPALMGLKDAIEAKGIKTGPRVIQKVGKILDDAFKRGFRSVGDVGKPVRDDLHREPVKHHATIQDRARLKDLISAIYAYRGDVATVAALKTGLLLGVRPGAETIKAEWNEIDLDKALWVIPGQRMKKVNGRLPEDHKIPLPRQMVEVFTALRRVTGRQKYVFASAASKTGHISSNTTRKALIDMGFEGEATPHGFRSTLLTLGSELFSVPTEVLDRQLGHKPTGALGTSYDKTTFFEQRQAVLQRWADWVEAQLS